MGNFAGPAAEGLDCCFGKITLYPTTRLMRTAFFGRILSLLLLVMAGTAGIAQTNNPTQNATPAQGPNNTNNKVQLEQASELIGEVRNGKEVRKIIGPARFRQNATLLYCDSAYLHQATDFIEAFGNVKIVEGDSVTVTGNNGTYDGRSRLARMYGNVVLNDKQMTLTTEQLDYNMQNNVAFYPDNGTIVDGENTLTSRQGYYDTRTKIFTFKENVKIVNPKYELTSESLTYHSNTKVAYFNTPTRIVGEDGTLVANNGEYNTATGVSNFTSRSTVEYSKYTLTGDILNYDKTNQIGYAEGNVVMVAKEDSTVIEGDIGRYFGQQGISRVYGNAVAKNIVNGDTLYLTADTLLSVEDKEKKTRRMFAYNHVKIFKRDLQGKCDSLIYNYSDSTIYFYRDPVLWNERSQLTGDTINIQLANNKMDKMFLRTNAFVISLDSIKNYNQMKGRQMVAFFNNKSQMDRVNVNGNGENITFVLNDENTEVRGVNKVECSNIIVRFKEGKVNSAAFLNKPDALFIPPHEVEEPSTRLKGFKWRVEEKPAKADVDVRAGAKPKVVEKPAKPAAPAKGKKKAVAAKRAL
jgi:lipopolysaccharide export system protein LptA